MREKRRKENDLRERLVEKYEGRPMSVTSLIDFVLDVTGQAIYEQWKCSYCQSSNGGGDLRCRSCGGAK